MFILIKRLYSPDPQPGDGPKPAPAPSPKPGETKPSESESDIVKAYAELKKNSVSIEEYNKLKAEKDEIIKSVIDGDGSTPGNGQSTPPEEVDIPALRGELYGEHSAKLSNLEYCKKTLKLRKAVIEKEGYDPFLPHGANIKPDSDDIEKANNVADVMEQCIEEADGNSEVFTALLQARTNNDSPLLTARLKKLEQEKKLGSKK